MRRYQKHILPMKELILKHAMLEARSEVQHSQAKCKISIKSAKKHK